MNKYLPATLFIFLFAKVSFSQGDIYSRKGEFYINWGYNQSSFQKSDIYFKGTGYEFTLKNIVAHDRPSHYKVKEYLNLSKLTIPQYNLRVGYFINHHLSLSLGTDHMKYVMDNDQMSNITGHISSKVSTPSITVNPDYVGDFVNTPFLVNSKDFLVFEHTDGFNYIHFELDHYNKIWKAKNKNMGLDGLVGIGAGLLVPRTDAHLFGIGRNHFWNIAGYGVSAKAGIRLDLTKRLYLQTDLKTGYTNLTNIKTTGQKGDFAKQKIIFYEGYIAFGFKFGKKSKKGNRLINNL